MGTIYTAAEFKNQVKACRDYYRADNGWFTTWNDDDVMDGVIQAAFNLYRATASNRLELVVLGGGENRTNPEYLRAFGITGVSGVDKGEKAAIDKVEKREMRRRKYRVFKAAVKVRNNPNADNILTPVVGGGSILCEAQWSPIMNDSLLLGAIHAGQEFFMGFTQAEQEDWDLSLKSHRDRGVKFQSSAYRIRSDVEAAFLAFFNSQKRIFWGPHGPRVFTRELLGLAAFGYVPVFSWEQLGFRPGGSARYPASHANYIQALRKVNFQTPFPHAKQINAAVSEYLFGDPKAIGAPWAPNTKTI